MKRAGMVMGAVAAGFWIAAGLGAGCGPFEYEEWQAQEVAQEGGGMGGAGGGDGGAGQAPVCTPGEEEICAPSWPIEKDGVGPCRAPRRTCAAKGSWGSCTGEVKPADDEIPGDAVDDNCDGTALVDEGALLARYFINEDPAGMPARILDSAQDPVDLTIVKIDEATPSITQDDAGHRGLQWPARGIQSHAAALIAGTKLKDGLHAKQKVTIELVAELLETVAGTRPVYIGSHDGFDALSLRFEGSDALHLWINDDDAGGWEFNLSTRTVTHVVIDTSSAEETRTRLFTDGILQAKNHPVTIAPTTAINTSTSMYLSLGSRPVEPNSPRGIIHYVAIYHDALSDTAIESNAALLLLDDDHP